MVYSILNGDALAYSFPLAGIEGEIIVVREALIDGDLSGESLNEFWQSRARYNARSLIEITASDRNNVFVIFYAP